MKIDKEKRRISLILNDGASIKGTVHLNHGERVLDYINDDRESFIAVTNAEFYYTEDVQSFKLAAKLLAKRDCVILNKSSIKWIEGI